MAPEQAVLSGPEREQEVVESLRGAEPGVLVAPKVDLRREGVGEIGADAAVGAVSRHYEIVLAGEARHFTGLELVQVSERHAEGAAAALEDLQQPITRDAGEAVPTRKPHLVAVSDLDCVPAIERVGDLLEGGFVVLLQVAKRLIGEHHAEAEGGIWRITLDHLHLCLGAGLLQQDRQIEAPRAAPDDQRLHHCAPFAANRGRTVVANRSICTSRSG